MNTVKLVTATALGLTLMNSCTQYQAQGAGLGALGGAAIGAVTGDDRRDVIRGAAIGAAVGTGVAAVQENQRRRAQADAEYYRNQEDRYDNEKPRRQTSDYPVAERTANPDQVISPYGPHYNVIDVGGFRSGELVRDPSNRKIFRVP